MSNGTYLVEYRHDVREQRDGADLGQDPVVTDGEAAWADQPDAALEAAFRSGTRDGLELAYQRYGRLIYTFCRRTVGHHSAEEVTQDVFVAAWKAAPRFDPDRGSLGGWLVGVARHKVVDHLRRGSREQRQVERVATVALRPSVGAPNEVDGLAEKLLVADALTALSPNVRELVELAFYSDMTHQQIAERTGQPLGTVKARIRRSLAALGRHLEGIDAAP